MIRLRADNGSPTNPIFWDDEKRRRPEFDQGAAVPFRIGVFSLNLPLNLTGYTSFELAVRPSAEIVADLIRVDCSMVSPTLTRATWEDGTSWQLEADFTELDTNYQLNTSRCKLWGILTALDPDGAPVTLGKGEIFLIRDNAEPGSAIPGKRYLTTDDLIVPTENLAAEVTRATAAEAYIAENLAAEVTRAQAAEAATATGLAAEVTRAQAAEAATATGLAAEVTRAQAAEAATATGLAAEVTRAQAAEAATATGLAAEVTRAQAAEQQIQSNLDGHSHNSDQITEGATNLYFTSTRVANWFLTGVAFATATAITAADSLLIALGKLQAQIFSEANNRAQADSNLQTSISSEASTRSTADSNLSTSISAKAPSANPTFTGVVAMPQLVINFSPTASTSGVRVTGTLFAGGTGTTTLPYHLYQPTGTTAATTWNTSGTWMGMNAAAGFAGSFLDFRINGGTSVFSVSASGNVATSGNITASGSVTCGAAQPLAISGRGAFRATADATWSLRNAANTADGNLSLGTLTLSGDLAVTGIPTGPTAAFGTNTTQFATTEFVQSAVAPLDEDLDAEVTRAQAVEAALGADLENEISARKLAELLRIPITMFLSSAAGAVDSMGYEMNEAGAVYKWIDVNSFSGNQANQTTPNSRPTLMYDGGIPVVSFDGVDDRFTFPMPMHKSLTLALCAKIANANTNQYILGMPTTSGGNNNAIIVGFGTPTVKRYDLEGTPNLTSNMGQCDIDDYPVYMSVFDGTNQNTSTFKDGVLISRATGGFPVPAGDWSIGSSLYGVIAPTNFKLSGFLASPASVSRKGVYDITRKLSENSPRSHPYIHFAERFHDSGPVVALDSYLQTSEFARTVFRTSSTSLRMAVYNNYYSTYPQFTSLGIWVDGSFLTEVKPTADGVTYHTVTLPGDEHVVEITNGGQSRTTPSGTVLGTFLLHVRGTAPLVEIPESFTERYLIYGDSTLFANADSEHTEAWTMILRQSLAPTSVALEGWGYRALHDDASDSTKRAGLVARLLSYDPTHLIIPIAVNDWQLNRWGHAAFGTAYGALLDDLHAARPGLQIYCQSPTITSNVGANSFGSTIQQFRDVIASNAASRPSYCHYINGVPILTLAQVPDGIHPGTPGHAGLAAAVLTALGY